MDFYDYVASSDPTACQGVCQKYGYAAQAETESELGACLEQLVGEMGEPALRDLVALHPDKELILEMYTVPAGDMAGHGQAAGGCGCAKCKNAGPVSEQYIHAASQQAGMNFLSQNHAGMFIIGGLIIVTLAIISQKN